MRFFFVICLFVCFSPQQDRRLRDTTRTGRRPSVFDEPASLSNTGRFKKALKESKLGCKLLQKMEPFGLEIEKGFSEPTSRESKEAKSLEIGVVCTDGPFARWHHLLLRPESFRVFLSCANYGFCHLNLAGITKYNYGKKNEKDSGRICKMTPSCKWPMASSA